MYCITWLSLFFIYFFSCFFGVADSIFKLLFLFFV